MNDVDADMALKELRACGVDEPEQLLGHASPERIVATCEWWRTRSNVTTGLLVSRIRKGGVEVVAVEPPSSVRKRQQEEFDRFAARFPDGAMIEPHARLQARRWPKDDLCSGRMAVFEALFPSLLTDCDACGFEAAYPLRVLKGPIGEGEREVG